MCVYGDIKTVMNFNKSLDVMRARYTWHDIIPELSEFCEGMLVLFDKTNFILEIAPILYAILN